MKGLSLADGRKLLAPVAIGALLLSAATIGFTRAIGFTRTIGSTREAWLLSD